jgi:hypothetical protein
MKRKIRKSIPRVTDDGVETHRMLAKGFQECGILLWRRAQSEADCALHAHTLPHSADGGKAALLSIAEAKGSCAAESGLGNEDDAQGRRATQPGGSPRPAGSSWAASASPAGNLDRRSHPPTDLGSRRPGRWGAIRQGETTRRPRGAMAPTASRWAGKPARSRDHPAPTAGSDYG